MNGILPLWKPAGMTSHDCVLRVRRLLGTKKVGHTGTLDPEAEGVLPLCIGRATKLVSYMTDTEKTYLATVVLGRATETEDASGQTIKEAPVDNMPDEEQINGVLRHLTGSITQVPPMYSAVRVAGKHLYEYARQNEAVERPERKVTIKSLQLVPPINPAEQTFRIQAVCSKGTYIRTLCVDIGKKLGYPAHMGDLIRSKTGAVSERETITFNEIERAVQYGRSGDLLLNMLHGIGHMDRLQVDEITYKKVLQGQKLPIPATPLKTEPFAIVYDKNLVAIYEYHPDKADQIKPVRVFN